MVKRERTAKKAKKKGAKRASKTAGTKKRKTKKNTRKKVMKIDQGMIICKIHTECLRLSNLIGVMAMGYSNYNGGR